MRIIAGERRGHTIDGPQGKATRPTCDLVREAVFNILGEAVARSVVLDLFAGTGALGLEALSRGASRAVFIERRRENLALIQRNIAALRYEDRARIVAADAYRWGTGFASVDEMPAVVFVDPPYRDYELHSGRVNRLLAHFVRSLPSGSFIVAESSRSLNAEVLPETELWEVRRYGSSQVAIRPVVAETRFVGDVVSRLDGPSG